MIGLRSWMLVGMAATLAAAPIARAQDGAAPPVSVQVVVTTGATGSATAGDGGAAQAGPVNVNVQVILNSPGAVTGPVSQSNMATGGLAAPATPPTPATPATPATPPTPAAPVAQAAPTPQTPSIATPATPATASTPVIPIPTPPPPPPAAIVAPPASAPAAAAVEPARVRHHHRSARPHRAPHVRPAAHVARTGTTSRPLITSIAPPAAQPAPAHRATRPARARADRPPRGRPPVAPPAHRFADFSQAGGGSGGDGFALFLALVLAFLLAGPAGPGEPVVALRQRARAALGGRLEHPG
jgi:hypothetical protein